MSISNIDPQNSMQSLIHLTTESLTCSSSTLPRLGDTRPRIIAKEISTMRGYWITVAVCVVGLLAAVPPKPLLAAQTPLVLDISVDIGPIAAQLDITKPVAHPAGVFNSTLHLHARDDTQTPAFNGNLVATGEAPDPDTLV